MRRVLRAPTLVAGAVAPWNTDRNGAPSIEEIEQAAYRRGVEEGRAMASEQFLAAAQAVQSAVAEQQARLRTEFDQQQDRLLETAIEIAEFLLGHSRHDGGAALRRRLEAALSAIDDTELVVAVNPTDVEAVEQLEIPSLTVTPDPSLQPGEARLTGEWSRTDITYAAALHALRSAVQNA